jgi:hypothetical protein
MFSTLGLFLEKITNNNKVQYRTYYSTIYIVHVLTAVEGTNVIYHFEFCGRKPLKTTKNESANKGTEEGIEGRVAYKYKTIFHFYEKVGTQISFVSTQISILPISVVCQSAKCKSANLE